MPEEIPLSEPHLGGNAKKYLEECLTTNFVSSVGPFVGRFEKEFATYVGTRHAVACSTGTAALHVAMRLLEAGPGDEVFVSTLTFAASVNAILYERATPVLVDSDRATWNMDPSLVEGELRRRAKAGLKQPKAVEVVHILGLPANIEPIREACATYGVMLIEDAAEALGATYASGKHVGTIGRIGCYSFNGNKIITTGGGGMIATDDGELARRAKHLTTQARLPGPEYRHDDVGYNYRLSNLAAALGVAQLEQLPAHVDAKRRIADRYDRALGDLPGIAVPPRPPWSRPTMWLYSIGIDPARFGCDRSRVLESLQAAGIQTRPIWTPLHAQPVYAGFPRLGGAVADELFARGLSLPCSVGLTESQQDRVIGAIRAAGR